MLYRFWFKSSWELNWEPHPNGQFTLGECKLAQFLLKEEGIEKIRLRSITEIWEIIKNKDRLL